MKSDEGLTSDEPDSASEWLPAWLPSDGSVPSSWVLPYQGVDGSSGGEDFEVLAARGAQCLAVTAPRARPPHNCWHSPWRGAHMGPAGQVGCTAGCGWGFEADLIPVHSPMMSRARMIHPIPIHRFTGFLGGPGDRFGRCCASR